MKIDKSQEKSQVQSKAIKVTLSPSDVTFIAKVAEELGISETDVLRKGLKLMGVYAEAQGDDARLVLERKKDKTKQELMII